MKKVTMTLAMMAMMMGLASCGTTKNADNSKKNQQDDLVASREDGLMDDNYLILSDAQRDIIENNNAFALNLFSQMKDFDSKVVSPMSVSYLMGMLANGADAQTRQEIMKAIGCEKVSLRDLNEFYQMLITRANHFDKATTINIADYIALNCHYQLKDGFASTMQNYYKAGVESLDFSKASTLKRINRWCSDHTDGMIPKIIEQVDADAVSYIMNAIYFNGTWTDKFDTRQTKLENFQGYTRDIKKTQMMHRNGKYQYMDNADFAAVNLPYGNGSYSMTVILPNRGKSIDEVMAGLDAKKVGELRRSMDECVVDLKLPRFTISQETSLNGIISKLGAPTMFTSGADFSNFASGNLSISKMLQKAKIEVSEEGTKASAVTMAMVAMTALRPEPRKVEFHANRPFIYMITEHSTGAILFMGQYTGSEL